MKGRKVDIKLVHVSLIDSTNTKLDEAKVQMIANNFDPEKAVALPAWRAPTGQFILTDGNHRLEAIKRLGHKHAPIAELTKAEFDYVAFSKRHVDLLVRIPAKVEVINPKI